VSAREPCLHTEETQEEEEKQSERESERDMEMYEKERWDFCSDLNLMARPPGLKGSQKQRNHGPHDSSSQKKKEEEGRRRRR
jgi:hypothetical protein